MSSNFYFHKWKETLRDLETLVEKDVHYQVTRAHDQKLSQAVHRLSAILGQYIIMYNQILECCQQNLQVQKTTWLDNILNAVIFRILEVKHQLEKLEGSRFQFLGYGLIEVHHTVYDIEMTEIPKQLTRPTHVQAKLEDIFAKVKEKRERMVQIEQETTETEEIEKTEEKRGNWWDGKANEEITSDKELIEVDDIPEAVRTTRKYLAMIFSHEKTRQVIKWDKNRKLKRETWEKDLMGLLKPQARLEIRERGANLIRTVFRAYFELKRERIKNCKRDELLGLNLCDAPIYGIPQQQAEEMLQNRSKLYHKYESEHLEHRKKLKDDYIKNKKAIVCEELRDQIREWFVDWFESIRFFHDIPKEGSAAIFRGEILEPHDWLEENKALALQKEANKKKSPQDLKFQKLEAKKQAMLQKREEQMIMKAEALLLKKMMKNPTMHPGYKYPPSKYTDNLVKVIDYYHKSWDLYDVWKTLDVKERHVNVINLEDAIMQVQLEVLPEVDEDMRQELRKLKQALKHDYKSNEEEMPVNLTKGPRRKRIKKTTKSEFNEKVFDMIENLVQQGFILEYPKKKLEEFIGDSNFGGEDLRTQTLPALPFHFEIRQYWWERCRDVSHGLRKILIVGPDCSGRTNLIYALASINDAVLFELDPYNVQGGLQSAPFLKRLVNMVVTCAKAVQPSVIRIKHIEKLFYSKIPPEEADMNLKIIKFYFVTKLIKNISKTDNITVIGTCTEPWLAKTSALLKQFPDVLLTPNNGYSLVVQVLDEWVYKNKVIPADFNVSNLAYVLQGYSFGYIQDALDNFMSADRIIKIAAYGLNPMEVYDFILEDKTQTKVDYDKYLNWYNEKTAPGRKEMKHLEEQRQFNAAFEKYVTMKEKKKAKSAPSSTTPSYTGL